jgi:hypothetical protein
MSGRLHRVRESLQWFGRELYERAVQKKECVGDRLRGLDGFIHGGSQPWRNLVRLQILGGVGFDLAPHVP